MSSKTYTVAFEGIEARLIEVQCAAFAGLPHLGLVGMADKSVSEARERVRAALSALSIALPNKRISLNLSPADLPKEGSHFDLSIALAILAEIGMIPAQAIEGVISLGELSLDGRLMPVTGMMSAALTAAQHDKILICPHANGAEATWIGSAQCFSARTLDEVLRHFTGGHHLSPPAPPRANPPPTFPDMSDIVGQERARRALEVAAAGHHHLLMIGPPGAGKTMLAKRLAGLLPPPDAAEALQTSMIHSLSGQLKDGQISRHRPFREPHHSATLAALTGGARNARPGEISLAHNGILFLDELPEFPRATLEGLRQPLENGVVTVARAHAHVSYPCQTLLIAAANPCRCGYVTDASRACSRAPLCAADYMGKISGPLMDRFDIRIEVPAVEIRDLAQLPKGEASAPIAARVAKARQIQAQRYANTPQIKTNAQASGNRLTEVLNATPEATELLQRAAQHFGFSARGYHRIQRVARTIADLAGQDCVSPSHMAEAVSYRNTTQIRQPA